MSIYIDMEMPEDSDMVVIYSDGTARKYLSYTKVIIDEAKAVPVPAHGRLIDVDALKTKGTDIRDTWVDYDGREDTVRGFSLDMLDHAPTIIPANEDK